MVPVLPIRRSARDAERGIPGDMGLLFDDDVRAPLGAPAPEQVHRPVTGWRRAVTLREEQLFLDGHAVELRADRAGLAFDVLLALAPEGTTRRLPPDTAGPLADVCRQVLTWSATGLDGVRVRGARAAAAAILRSLGVKGDGETPLERDLLGDGPLADWADWVLSSRPVYTLQEDSYELTRDDVALLWCGLALCDGPEAFPWLRSGIVIFHECQPVGQQISDASRRAWAELLASSPVPYDFKDWQDRVVGTLDGIRAQPVLVRSRSTPSRHQRVMLSPEQRRALGDAWEDPDLQDAFEAFAGWFPDATDAGAIPQTTLRALHRVASDPHGPERARAREDIFGARLQQVRAGLRERRWEEHDVDGALAAGLLVVLMQQVELATDLDALGRAVALGMDSDQLGAFVAGWTGVPHWQRLPRWLSRRWVCGELVHPAQLAGTLEVQQGHDRLLLLEARVDHASAGATLFATDGRSTSSAVCDARGGWDSAGRRTPASGEPWLRADVHEHEVVYTLLGPPPSTPLLFVGDEVDIGEPATVVELEGTRVQLSVLRDGQLRFVRATEDQLEIQPHSLPIWERRRRIARV